MTGWAAGRLDWGSAPNPEVLRARKKPGFGRGGGLWYAQTGASIDGYLFSGEASRSSESTLFLDAFKTIGDLLVRAKTVQEDTGIAPDNRVSQFVKAVEQAQLSLTSDDNPFMRAGTALGKILTD